MTTGVGEIVVMTDFGSVEESRPKLSAAVEVLTGTPPVVVDARAFMTGQSGRATLDRGRLTLEVPSEGLRVSPAVILMYEIPPTDRRRFEAFLQIVRQSTVVALSTDPEAWRNATEKDRMIRRFVRDHIPHMETVCLRRPSMASAIGAFEQLGQDVWARPAVGAGGRDVFHITTHEELRAAARHYCEGEQDWLVSRDARNFDDQGLRHQFRVIVLGDRVLRVCEHVQADPDAPCNELQGAVSTVIANEELPADFLRLAVAATSSLGLQFGGADLAFENGGVVFEVNVHPVIAPIGGLEAVAIPFVQAHLDALRLQHALALVGP